MVEFRLRPSVNKRYVRATEDFRMKFATRLDCGRKHDIGLLQLLDNELK